MHLKRRIPLQVEGWLCLDIVASINSRCFHLRPLRTRIEVPAAGQGVTAPQKGQPDEAAQYQALGGCQRHPALVALAVVRIITSPVLPPVFADRREVPHHLQAKDRLLPQRRIGVVAVDLHLTDRPLLPVGVVWFLEPDDLPADMCSAPGKFQLGFVSFRAPSAEDIVRIAGQDRRRPKKHNGYKCQGLVLSCHIEAPLYLSDIPAVLANDLPQHFLEFGDLVWLLDEAR